MMKKHIRFWLGHSVFFIILFIVIKITFFIVYVPFSLSDLLQVIGNGFIMDLSASAYSLLLPSLLLAFSPLMRGRWLRISMRVYIVLYLLLIVTLFIADLELYRHWGFRMDATVFRYLSNPGDAMASVSILRLTLLVFSVIALTALLVWLYNRFLIKKLPDTKTAWWAFPVFLVLGGSLILPIRGGLYIQPLNLGNVYFSNRQELNHAAENVFWKMGFTLTNINPQKNPYVFFSETPKLPERNFVTGRSMLRIQRPNIVLVILESFNAKIIGPCGGLPDVTPCFNRLAENGILFSHCYASGERTDKGLVSILSGYPSQPDAAIMTFPGKTGSLPQLSLDLSRAGYQTAFYYGGDPDFASMNSYIAQGKFNRTLSLKDFAGAEQTKWGIFDHILLDSVYKDLGNLKPPFFAVCLTLSNHEPFVVPISRITDRKNEADEFLNAAAYTDLCIGRFMADCAHQPWFQNTLFIFIADHGHTLPDYCPSYHPEKFRIPLLFTGPALNPCDSIISSPVSQTDLAATLLNKLGIKNGSYHFSRNLFSTDQNPTAFYLFNNGFGIVASDGHVVFDNNSRSVIEQVGNNNDSLLHIGKQLMQVTYNDFVSK